MAKHWSNYSVYAIARAIAEQYNTTDWDLAFELAWYGRNDNPPIATSAQVFARMSAVKNVPTVPAGAIIWFRFHLQRLTK